MTTKFKEIIKSANFIETGTKLDKSNKKYTIYKIQVDSEIYINGVLSETNTTYCTKRYSDFWEFDKTLTFHGIKTPKLPRKKLLTTMSSCTISSRRQKLSKYLNTLINDKLEDRTLPYLQDFLKEKGEEN